MYFFEKWQLLSTRITGAHAAGTHITQVMQINSSDGRIINKFPETLKEIGVELKRFQEEYGQELPKSAREAFDSFLDQWVLGMNCYTAAGHDYAILHSLAALISFQSEFNFLIADTDIEICTRTERAFEHLKRSIAVDAFMLRNNNEKNKATNKTKWQAAYEEGELVCEKLGAVHLLQHGIWAFKVDGIGGKTDLVYNEPIDEKSLKRSASNLVLTEWKKITDAEKCTQTYLKTVRDQVKEYTSGVLGGIELKNTRYIVLVSKENLNLLLDPDPINGIQYRYINIPVTPDLPSRV